ncbi:thiopurine S-methyltransferase [Acinetobacter sp. MD2(2019)]|uniref:thiopurine S-methyltransferase n=1 Tax=Acinetobacter sp. MD2(2019) TaxID=2605273 RepID=UPI002D1F37DB|nr:thiopurine S-methyltransferase [Acinetobacter sp. MD2(2019)]MEB3755070.1 thiopurine S-methyltransferase [Acinetobacter sp. MD2(2019)]
MQHEFWHQRWQDNKIGFHQFIPSPLLVEHFNQLNLNAHARIFVPLSGKTLDLSWFLQQEYKVVAIELSHIAVTSLMEQLAKDFEIHFEVLHHHDLIHYHHPQIDLYVGDFFNLSHTELGHVDAIYDRAALIALPDAIRFNYAKHLVEITNAAPQFLISYEYDAGSHEGPPFSVNQAEIQMLYAKTYNLKCIQEQWVDPIKNKGNNPKSTVWQLTAKL